MEALALRDQLLENRKEFLILKQERKVADKDHEAALEDWIQKKEKQRQIKEEAEKTMIA